MIAGNLASAGFLGAAVWYYADASIPCAVIVATIAFVALTGSLLHRRAFWIGALFGGAALSSCSALLLAGVGLHIGGHVGSWIGAALGVALGAVAAFSGYSQVARAALRRGDAEPR